MKTKIYYIVSEIDGHTKVQLFGTEAEQIAAQKHIIETDMLLEEGCESRDLNEVRALLAEGLTLQAWVKWNDKIKGSMFSHEASAQEVELSLDTLSLVDALVQSISVTKAEFHGDHFKVTIRKS